MLLLTSTTSMATSCAQLGITIQNETEHECVLKSKRMDQGVLLNEIADVIAPHTQSPVFYTSQDSFGIGLMLDYRCGNKLVMLYSMQEYCFLSAGNVQGFSYYVNDLNTDHRITQGSYWNGVAGQIAWRIY